MPICSGTQGRGAVGRLWAGGAVARPAVAGKDEHAVAGQPGLSPELAQRGLQHRLAAPHASLREVVIGAAAPGDAQQHTAGVIHEHGRDVGAPVIHGDDARFCLSAHALILLFRCLLCFVAKPRRLRHLGDALLPR